MSDEIETTVAVEDPPPIEDPPAKPEPESGPDVVNEAVEFLRTHGLHRVADTLDNYDDPVVNPTDLNPAERAHLVQTLRSFPEGDGLAARFEGWEPPEPEPEPEISQPEPELLEPLELEPSRIRTEMGMGYAEIPEMTRRLAGVADVVASDQVALSEKEARLQQPLASRAAHPEVHVRRDGCRLRPDARRRGRHRSRVSDRAARHDQRPTPSDLVEEERG